MSGPYGVENPHPHAPDSGNEASAVPNEGQPARRHAGSGQLVANENGRPSVVVVLHPTGDGSTLYRALARVLVRRELAIVNGSRDDADDAAA